MKFLDRMFTAFFARQKPVSNMPKPVFMKNTKNAAMSTHRVSATTF